MNFELQTQVESQVAADAAPASRDASASWHAPRERTGEPVVQIDVAAVLGGFLKELAPIDVVVELIQNELDAGSTSTRIELGPDALVCTGKGSRIDPKGWKRLVYVLGAGGEVEAKEDGIGAKNHGIRSGFLLGDDIVVQCDRHRVELTLRGDMRNRDRFSPAAWPKERDDAAPAKGTRVSVGYRRIERPVPGHNPLVPPTPSSLDELFAEAVRTCPNRFLFASAPARSWDYELVLERGQRRVTFRYQARPFGRGLFLRTCTRIDGARSRRVVERRLCSTFNHDLAAGDTAKVPRLYRRKDGLVGEIGWPCDSKGRPVPGTGELRYPIAFPVGDIRSSSGFDISAPFVAGRARHSLGEDARNGRLLERARETIVDVVRRELAPRFGPESLRLLENAAYPTPTEVQNLVRRLHASGGLPIAPADERRRHQPSYALSTPNQTLLLAVPSYSGGKADRNLAALARDAGEVLHPGCPDVVGRSLLQSGAAFGRPFDEMDAARLVFDAQAPATGQGEETWLRRCLGAVKLLELARMHETLDAEALRALKGKGRLPSSDGTAAPWMTIKRAKHTPPPVPGVPAPQLLHPALLAASTFRDGPGSVDRFRIDRYLSHLDFGPTSSSTRASFFAWLLRSHTSLHQKTLGVIGRYPIWPGADGQFRPLEDYCWPRAPYLREILAQVGSVPADSVISFPALGASSTSLLRLRRTPRMEELRAWHASAMAEVETLRAGDAEEARRVIAEVEARLDRLRTDKFQPREVGPGHMSVSRSGTIRPMTELHVESAAVSACDLRAVDLALPRNKALYLALEARSHPSPAALVGALREKPDEERLLPRLAAYRSTGRPLSDLSGDAIVPVAGELLRPDQLAFPSSTDFWGEWKRRLPSVERSPDAVRLLEEAGTIRASLREEQSRAFFTWLAAQPTARQQQHLPQIVRHWNDGRAGPQRWAGTAANLPLIPARDGNRRFWLLPLSEATRSKPSVYLADFPEMQEQVLADNPKLKLAISEHRDVDGSSLDALRACGVRSLRLEAGRPRRLTIEGESRDSAELEAELAKLRSRPTLMLLPKLLPQYEIRGEPLVRSWRRLIKEIKGVRVAEGLLAVHGLFRREYPAPVLSGFDEKTAQVCVSDRSNGVLSFYEAVARLVFEAGSPVSYAFGLYRAVNDPSQADMFAALDLKEETEENETPASRSADEAPKAGPHDPHKGHGLPSDAKPFAPNPKPLDPLDSLTFPNPGAKRKKARRSASTDGQRHSLEEDAQIQKLKNDHYAVHCQACIGSRDIGEAVPPETYVFSPHFRRSLIQAHHVEHLQNKPGGQGAQNLLILCRYHHAQLGDQLTRAMVIAGLRAASPLVRRFPSGNTGQSVERHGLRAAIALPQAPHEVILYFTKEHAQAWLRG